MLEILKGIHERDIQFRCKSDGVYAMRVYRVQDLQTGKSLFWGERDKLLTEMASVLARAL